MITMEGSIPGYKEQNLAYLLYNKGYIPLQYRYPCFSLKLAGKTATSPPSSRINAMTHPLPFSSASHRKVTDDIFIISFKHFSYGDLQHESTKIFLQQQERRKEKCGKIMEGIWWTTKGNKVIRDVESELATLIT